MLEIYKIEENDSSLEEAEIEDIIRLLRWADKTFRDGYKKSARRIEIVEKLKKLKEYS